MFGNDFDEPIRDRLPPGFGKAFSLVRWMIDPGLDGDPYADRPYLYGPALSSLDVLRVGEKMSSLPGLKGHDDDDDDDDDDGFVIEEGADGDGIIVRQEKGVPKDAPSRKKWFLDESRRKDWSFDAGRLYQADFFNPYLDFNGSSLKPFSLISAGTVFLGIILIHSVHLVEFSLKIPGFTLPILKFLDTRDIK